MIDRRRGSWLYPIISGERRGPAGAAARMGLGMMSSVYAAGLQSRMRRYAAMEKTKVAAPVVSVGNITLGGTGKTPVCRFLAKGLEDRGRAVGVATRGYGREGTGTVVIRPDTKVADWHQCGDEALLLVRGMKDMAVAIDRDRSAAARALVEKHGRDVVLLDDGFQFISLERDVNIAVIDPVNPFGFGKMIPAGLLREPISSLSRADVFWIAKADAMQPELRKSVMKRFGVEFPGRPVVESVYEPVRFSEYGGGGRTAPPDGLKGKRAMCVSGIGIPEAFENLVARLCETKPVPFRFTDHHPFGADDMMEIEEAAIKAGLDMIVTTEKDSVRIPGFFKPKCEWWILEIGVSVKGVSGDAGRLGIIRDIVTGAVSE